MPRSGDTDGGRSANAGGSGLLNSAGFSSGDYVTLDTHTAYETYNTTNTSYANVAGSPDRYWIDGDALPADADLYIRLTAALSNDTGGETTFMQISDSNNAFTATDTEISVTGTTVQVASARAAFDPTAIDGPVRWEMKVSAGTGSTDYATHVAIEAQL